MKIAIIGAGVSGLSAAISLEKYGIVPDIFEQNSFISDHYSHVGVLFNMAYRGISTKPLKHINKLLSIEISPLERITDLIIHSRHSKATISKETIGFSFIMGQEPLSIGNQLLNNIKNSKILYEQRQSVEELSKKYDYVIVATGSRGEDYVADRYLTDWKQYLATHTRVAKLYGDFNTNTAIVWGNKEIVKDGYGFFAPFSSKIGSLYVTIPHLKNWEEFNYCWKKFLKKERILEKTTLLGTYDRTHVAANSSTKQWKNCLFVGDQGGFLDPFLGLGAATAIITGIMAAKSIALNKDYDELTQKYKKIINTMSNFRYFYDSIDDDTFDKIVKTEANPYINKIIYGTNIDWLKYGSKAIGPFVSEKTSPNFHEISSSPT
ncbi:NAD(P)/FAD-dependent oxidoreductase [Desulfotomaculum sp. 1211_IL3151]|uniref:NAD(P)/FAD-dependent oxidoreductase n=1 Tax=Desulfotomaculum sp. 1211_IL3151 TaxID=3084055 RepID=UPI002FD88B67